MKKARLNKQNTKKLETTEDFTTKTKIITMFVLLLTLGGFYFLTEKIVEKQNKELKERNKEINVREDNDINYSDIDSIKDESYYLLLDKEDDEKNKQYDNYINSLKSSNYGVEYYYIDLSKDENKDLLGDISNQITTGFANAEVLKELKELKVKDTTLIFVEDGKIKETYVGSEKILNQLMSYFIKSAEDNNSNDGLDEFDKENFNSNKESKSNSNKDSKSNKEEKKDK